MNKVNSTSFMCVLLCFFFQFVLGLEKSSTPVIVASTSTSASSGSVVASATSMSASIFS